MADAADILEGRSALGWMTLLLRSGIVTGAAFVLFAIFALSTSVTRHGPWRGVFEGGMGVFGVVFGAGVITTLLTFGQVQATQRREATRGYSTMPMDRAAVDVIDPSTGRLLRAAHEPALTTRDDVGRARLAAASRPRWNGPTQDAGQVSAVAPASAATTRLVDDTERTTFGLLALTDGGLDVEHVALIHTQVVDGITEELHDWDPLVGFAGRLLLGFSREGISMWQQKPLSPIGMLALRSEVVRLEKATIHGVRNGDFTAMKILLAPRELGPGGLTFWVLKDSGHGFPQDEYAVGHAIAKGAAALGPAPGSARAE